MQTALIIGAKGSLGRELQDLLIGKFDIYIDDKDTLDITNGKVVFKRIKEVEPDVVFNCAAINDIDKAEQNVDETMQINGYAVENIAKACENFGAVLVQFSTGCVFNGETKEPYTEDSDKFPQNIYGKSKALGEDFALNYCSKTYIIRTSWTYGAYGYNFIKALLEKAKQGRDIKVMSKCKGTPTWIRDIGNQIRIMLEERYPYGVYHVVNEGMTDFYDLAQKIFELKELRAKLVPIEGEEVLEHSLPYNPLINTKIGPLRTWEEALSEYLRVF